MEHVIINMEELSLVTECRRAEKNVESDYSEPNYESCTLTITNFESCALTHFVSCYCSFKDKQICTLCEHVVFQS